MCLCDEELGRRFLSHQLDEGVELETQDRVSVTGGFVEGICSECRGLPAEPAPMAAIHGRTSKIKRYYWRELYFAEQVAFSEWLEAHPTAGETERGAAASQIGKEVLEVMKARHAADPKYQFDEPSEAEWLSRYEVDIEALSAIYAEGGTRDALIVSNGVAVSAEGFATNQYEALGWSVMQLESRPFHVLFGVMFWMVIQGADPRLEVRGFGARGAPLEASEVDRMIWTLLPPDFGTSGYAKRRSDAIEEHFELLPPDKEELLWLFDLWVEPSEQLRQYLWAHDPSDIERARRLIEILPPNAIIATLRYLIADYWRHYIGWPDLIIWKGHEFCLVEVKSSSDKLSAEQRGWIAGNHDHLHLPFKLVKLHRVGRAPYP